MEPTQPPTPESKPGEILAFFVKKETKCAECGCELFKGRMITLEKDRGALCLECADLDELEYLPRGDAAVTRRTTKYSKLRAVVLEWSRSRKRYERQGILAEPDAIARAEAECLEDADVRERQRERRRIRDAALDKEYVAAFAEKIRERYPKCPKKDATEIAEHACLKHSGRVGRSAAAKEMDANAIRLAVGAAIRHRYTDYDRLLLEGCDRREARAQVSDAVTRKLQQWAGQ